MMRLWIDVDQIARSVELDLAAKSVSYFIDFEAASFLNSQFPPVDLGISADDGIVGDAIRVKLFLEW